MYWWYALGPMVVRRLRDLLAACPDSLQTKFHCALHRSLRESGERLWGGVKHTVDPAEKIAFAWLLLEEQPDRVTLEVDQPRGPGQAV